MHEFCLELSRPLNNEPFYKATGEEYGDWRKPENPESEKFSYLVRGCDVEQKDNTFWSSGNFLFTFSRGSFVSQNKAYFWKVLTKSMVQKKPAKFTIPYGFELEDHFEEVVNEMKESGYYVSFSKSSGNNGWDIIVHNVSVAYC